MTIRKLSLAALILVAVLAGFYFLTEAGKNMVGDFFDKSLPPPARPAVLLKPPFSSQMSTQQATGLLSKQQYQIDASKNHVPKVKNIPAKNLDTLVVSSYRHYDVSGVLTLEFLDDKLYEVVFNPYVPEEYVAIARNRLGLRPDPRRNGRSEKLDGQRRVASNIFLAVNKVGKSLGTKPYVIWQDLYLLEQRRR